MVITAGEWINKICKYSLSGMLSGEKKEGGKGGRKEEREKGRTQPTKT